jgi:hypothetical protein
LNLANSTVSGRVAESKSQPERHGRWIMAWARGSG